MAVLSAVIVPHPPLLVPEVGWGQEKLIQETVNSYHEVMKMVARERPETIILISPHAVAYSDYIHIAPGDRRKGSLKQFGDERETEVLMDEAFAQELCRLCEQMEFPAGTLGEKSRELDHGTQVPLYFLNQYWKEYRLVICSLSGLPREDVYRFGMIVNEAVERLDRRAVVIASGDLSHALKESGPYQFAKEGPELDKCLTDTMKSGNFIEFLEVDEELCRLGAECGLGSFITMAGILDRKEIAPKFLSYEGTFGVGYGVSFFSVLGEDESRNFRDVYLARKSEKIEEIRAGEDIYVNLARRTLEYYVCEERLMPMPDGLPQEMLAEKAGTFVSIKKNGQLRGCIGTIASTQDNMAMEIMYNAISAGTRDPRFSRVTEEELALLVYHVDILSEARPVDNKNELDAKRFGVIVTKGSKRGLLLPNLDGVDTVEQQMEIVCQKAGIGSEEDYFLECFEVVRHE